MKELDEMLKVKNCFHLNFLYSGKTQGFIVFTQDHVLIMEDIDSFISLNK